MPRGRRPTPTALKLVRGNPGKRKLPKDEPKPAAAAVAPAPDWLLPAARVEWDRVMPELVRLNILTVLDTSTLAGYCQSFARWKEAEAQVELDGAVLVFRTDKGEVKYVTPSPWIGLADKYFKAYLRAAVELGFTPASRSKVHAAPKQDEADPFDKLFGGAKA